MTEPHDVVRPIDPSRTMPPDTGPPEPQGIAVARFVIGELVKHGPTAWSALRGSGGPRDPVARLMAGAAALGLIAWIIAHEAGSRDIQAQLEANRTAIYELIDVIAKDNPDARKVERGLNR